MKTIPELIDSAAAESFPGTTFARDLKVHAAELLEREMAKAARKALRKAILSFRPPSPAGVTAQRLVATSAPSPAK